MKILTTWLRSYLPPLDATDRQLAEDLTLRGIAVEGVFDLGVGADGKSSGSLFEMDITTNRVDAMNHYGIAREAAAIYNVPLLPLDAALADTASSASPRLKREARGTQSSSDSPYPVRIEAPDLCGRFTAQVLRDVSIGVSTGTVAEYFRLLEQKQISSAVDATNFVWMAMGHPTHAFDLDKLEGGIVVRRARKGEKIKLLDGTERTLEADDLVVADEKKAVALAGVMGGWETMITPETRNVLVEAAWFDPAAIRRSSRRHGLHTDASHRFERGADFNSAPIANALVTKLILQNGGSMEGALVDVVVPEAAARTADRAGIALAVSEVKRHLGETADGKGISAEIVEQYLTALGCRLQPVEAGAYAGADAGADAITDARTGAGNYPRTCACNYQVKLPSWRLDLEREIDLIEEVARVYGYNRFANTLPAFAGAVVELPLARKEAAVRSTMLALGYSEAVSSTFCSGEEAAMYAAQPASAVPMGNPLSEEAGMLRPSLLPGMLGMLAHNLHRDVHEVRLFEIGTAFAGSTERVDENSSLAFGATGSTGATALYAAKDALFYELKGAVEAVLGQFSSRSVYFDAFAPEAGLMPQWLHAGRAARVVLEGVTVGYFGQLCAAEAQQRKLKVPVYIGEIYLHRLYKHALRQPVGAELSRYPAVERDFSFVFADEVKWERIATALDGLQMREMIARAPREIFRDATGKAIAAGHYSLLVRTVFQSRERTLRVDEIQAAAARVAAALESLGGVMRA